MGEYGLNGGGLEGQRRSVRPGLQTGERRGVEQPLLRLSARLSSHMAGREVVLVVEVVFGWDNETREGVAD